MLQQLITLFETDSRLKKTIPESYELDPVKVKLWNELNDLNMGSMEVYKVSFQDWQVAFAKCIEHILSELNKGVVFVMSTGVSYLEKQSVSELWTFYIVRKILELNEVKFEEIDQHWMRASKGKSNGTTNILFVDDFMFSGTHMSDHVCVAKFPLGEYFKIVITVAIAPSDCEWKEPFKDFQSEYGVDRMDMVQVFVGLPIDLPRRSRLLFDHKSLEECNDDLHFGYLGKLGYIGSLLKGADPLCLYQHPPALYHVEFGSGKLPKSHYKLTPVEGRPGFYK